LVLLAAGAVFLLLFLPAPAAAEPEGRQVKIYADDPEHLWNRLHVALFVRTTAQGKSYGHDEGDPLLWPESTFLLTGEHHKHVLALLDEFLARDGDRLVKDPLRRAVFQHDLWAIFDWLADRGDRHGRFSSERRALYVRLAKVIRRLALSKEEIDKLPDG